MDDGTRPTLGIVGAGRVGTVIGRLAHAAGYRVVAFHSRRRETVEALAAALDAAVVDDAAGVLLAADLTLLTLPDDAIETVARSAAADLPAGALAGKAVIHTSGAHSIEPLAALAERGAQVGSLHPAYPFADPTVTLAQFAGVGFAVEAADELLRGWLLGLVAALDGQAITIPPGQKVRYHAALVLTSNFSLGLVAHAQQMLIELGASEAAAQAALLPLLSATVQNLRVRGLPAALTGPLSRGDVGTVAAHLRDLDAHAPPTAALYRALAAITLPLAAAQGVTVEPIAALLHAPDARFWQQLDALVSAQPLVIDRPAGSAHPRYPDVIYPFDYGYLDGTSAADGAGINVFIGSLAGRQVTGVLATVDVFKRDVELKVLLGCTTAEMQQIAAFMTQDMLAATLIQRP